MDLSLEAIQNLSMYERVDFLDQLLVEYTQIKNNFVYKKLDENETYDITYCRYIYDYGILAGLKTEYKFQQYKIKEQTKLRANCKNYNVFYKKNGKIVQVDYWVDGYLSLIYKAYYIGNKRYFIPFYASGKLAYSDSIVAVFENDKIIEEYLIIDNGNVVYSHYDYADDHVDYTYLNYVPNGKKYKLLSKCKGIFTFSDRIEYKNLYWDDWYEIEYKR